MTRIERAGVDLVVQLSDDNALQNCRLCDLNAEFYVYTDSTVSMYVCGDHLDEAVKQAQS